MQAFPGDVGYSPHLRKAHVKLFYEGIFLPACICMELGRWFKIFHKIHKVDDVRNYIITNKLLFYEKRAYYFFNQEK